MNCRSVREQLWSDRGGFPATEVEAHLGGCSACAEAAAEVHRMRSWLHELPVEEPSAQFEWRLRLRLSQASETGDALPAARSPWTLRAPLQFATSMAAAAVVVLAVGLLLTRSQDPASVSATGQQTVSTSGTGTVPVSPPSLVQVRSRTGLGETRDALRLENTTVRNDTDSTLVVPRR